jgi:hypothetical protein
MPLSLYYRRAAPLRAIPPRPCAAEIVVALALGRALLRPRGDARRDAPKALAVGLVLVTLATAPPVVGGPICGRRRLPRRGSARLAAGPDRRSRAKLGAVTVERGTAAGILTPERAAEWAARRARRDDPLLRGIWRRFIEAGGPVTLRAASGALPGLAPEIVRARAVALDAADLIGLDGDRVRLAYPFTTGPNEFEVVLPGGRVRYACCAIDALGVAPMIGRAVRLRARCHRSGAPLAFEVDPVAGPRDAPPGSLAWVERGRWGGDRLSGFL